MAGSEARGQEELVMCGQLDEVVWPEHAVFIVDEDLPSSITGVFPKQRTLFVKAGEQLKKLTGLEMLASGVLEIQSSRPLTLVAVGGGSVGDAVGFLASTLWRGVDLWHVPTTLLAMVDSAHGGKTAVNLHSAKNQLGTFYPADKILIVKDILGALPLEQRRHGLTELIKGLWLGDANALLLLDDISVEALAFAPFDQVGDTLMTLLEQAIRVKKRVVQEDPFETRGIRTILNLGHTAAHALELEMGAPHGLAVAWGMAAAAKLSVTLSGMSVAESTRWLAHLEPLLEPLQFSPLKIDRERFISLVRKDKKRINNQLRSVLLQGPAQPEVVTSVSGEMWYDTLCDVYDEYQQGVYEVDWSQARNTGFVRLPVSKSEYNRALMIAALGQGHVQVELSSGVSTSHLPDDVFYLAKSLEKLEKSRGCACVVEAGLGGTTLRFLMVAALVHAAPVEIVAEQRLLERPHDALVKALESVGALVDVTVPGCMRVTPPVELPDVLQFSVDIATSSQYASALAMLAVSGHDVRLDLVTSEDGSFDPAKMVSVDYLHMTLGMLEDVGVVVDADFERGEVTLKQGECSDVSELVVWPDESSAAFWRAANFLGADVRLSQMPASSRQVDRRLVDILAGFQEVKDSASVYTVDLNDAPDLAPVLSAVAIHCEAGLEIVNAAHLRLKESNRIEDLVGAYAQVGVKVEARDDGLYVPVGRQVVGDGIWPTLHDHRLAMAGLIAAFGGSVKLVSPWVSAKSYPGLMTDLRAVGVRFKFLK